MSLSAKEAFARLPKKLHNFFIKYPPRPLAQYADKALTIDDPQKNPFFPNKNPETGAWHGPKYSLRRLLDLYKMARKFGVADLLPAMPKRFYEEKYNDKHWMKGVLSHKKQKWERELPEKLAAREEAIRNMDATIVAARPDYKKQLAKKEQRKQTWF